VSEEFGKNGRSMTKRY